MTDLTVFHTCEGHPDGHVGTFTPMSRTRLGCGCNRFRLRRCDGTDMHVFDGACHPARRRQRAGVPMTENAAIVRVLRCPCGKAHVAAGVSEGSECTCGERLWPLLWDGTAR